MAFQPDIVVTTPDGIALVIEAKVSLPNLERAEEGLKLYMVGVQCPLGLLITPERMWLYRDLYTTRSAQSVQRIGEYDPKPLWKQPPPLQRELFESFVQHWIEGLPGQPPKEVPNELREALRDHILPAVRNGDVRAAHPRYS